MNPTRLPDPWSELLNAFADELLTDEQKQELERLLRVAPEFRREFVLHCQLLSQLSWQCGLPCGESEKVQIRFSEESSRATTRKASLRRWAWMAAAVLLIGLGSVVFVVSPKTPSAVLTDSVGKVLLLRDGQPAHILQGEAQDRAKVAIQSGDHIQTGRFSSVKLTFSDGSRIQLRQESDLVISKDSSNHIELERGSLAAQVTRQASHRSLTFESPQASVQVLGTNLEILALPDRSEVAVEEGKVRVTRTSDKSSTEVAGAQVLSITATGPLAVVSWPQPGDSWSEDFEHGLPQGWVGKLGHEELPAGSSGAVAATPLQHFPERILEISSPEIQSGLFAWHEDSVLHLTFKMDPPGWFHLYLFARTYEHPDSSMTYCLIEPELWQKSAGEWQTVSIPLSNFRRLSDSSTAPSLGRIPTRIALTGQSSSQIAIDRIWIDRSSTN